MILLAIPPVASGFPSLTLPQWTPLPSGGTPLLAQRRHKLFRCRGKVLEIGAQANDLASEPGRGILVSDLEGRHPGAFKG